MRIIRILSPGVYLWESAPMCYNVGSVSTNFLVYTGWTLDEVLADLEKREMI